MPAPRRIMHIITGLGSGGAEGQLALLAARQRADGEEPVVISLVPGGPNEAKLVAAGVTVKTLGMRRGWPAPGAVVRLVGLIRRYRPEILQSWLFHADLLGTIALVLSGRRRETSLIWSLRCSELEFDHYSPMLKFVVKACALLSRLACVVTANSIVGRDFYRSLGYRPKSFRVIANGIEIERFRPDAVARREFRRSLGIAENTFILAIVARVDPMKDYATFCLSLKQLPDCLALAVGEGTETLPDLPNLRRLGVRDDVPRLLAASDILVSSSAFGEGFSNAIAEGMAAGLPAVATDVGDARAIIGDTGAIVPPRNQDCLAQAISDILAGDHLTMGQRARERIIRNYSVSQMVDAYTALYADCLKQRTCAA